MKSILEKDKLRRDKVCSLEVRRLILKSIIRNQNLLNKTRWAASLELSNLCVDSSRSRVVNRCLLTARKSKVSKLYSFSRLAFLRLARNGLIKGLKKVSW